MHCTPSTLAFYNYTAGKFLEWIEQRGVISADEVGARYVREYIAELVSNGKKDRSAVIGATTRRVLLAYKRSQQETTVVFPSREGARFTGSGLLRSFQRLSKRTGIHGTP
jgi:site-specific recombinase XerD